MKTDQKENSYTNIETTSKWGACSCDSVIPLGNVFGVRILLAASILIILNSGNVHLWWN